MAGLIAARLRLSTKRRNGWSPRRSGSRSMPNGRSHSLMPSATRKPPIASCSETGIRPWRARRPDGKRPRFPLTGGDLIAMGLAPGPVVARTLQRVERAWVAGGFEPDRESVRALARAHVDQALRDSQ
jgi:hypothetical protein